MMRQTCVKQGKNDIHKCSARNAFNVSFYDMVILWVGMYNFRPLLKYVNVSVALQVGLQIYSKLPVR